ncbi:hypothetical protein [Streptomyces sp. NPDC002962]|uniref:hypothetical protein n=1 Tax=Streptomyces sp. NPDC002962 TaxID=3364674 RepID=UPI00368ABF25
MLPTAVAPAVGPVLGGWLVDTASWHWMFLVNLPVGVLALLFGLGVLPDFAGPGAPRFDMPGLVLAAVLAVASYAERRRCGPVTQGCQAATERSAWHHHRHAWRGPISHARRARTSHAPEGVCNARHGPLRSGSG